MIFRRGKIFRTVGVRTGTRSERAQENLIDRVAFLRCGGNRDLRSLVGRGARQRRLTLCRIVLRRKLHFIFRRHKSARQLFADTFQPRLLGCASQQQAGDILDRVKRGRRRPAGGFASVSAAFAAVSRAVRGLFCRCHAGYGFRLCIRVCR